MLMKYNLGCDVRERSVADVKENLRCCVDRRFSCGLKGIFSCRVSEIQREMMASYTEVADQEKHQFSVQENILNSLENVLRKGQEYMTYFSERKCQTINFTDTGSIWLIFYCNCLLYIY